MKKPIYTTWTHLAMLAVAVLAVFGAALRNGFVWDDATLLVGRSVYRHFDLARIFLTPANDVEYLPLRDVSYALDFALWGESAAGFHATSLLLYLGNVILVYFLCRRLLPSMVDTAGDAASRIPSVALICALLFAVHPLHSETVNFITCRNVVLSGFFFFASLLFWLSAFQGGTIRRSHYGAALGCFLGALLSKATVIILPLLLVLPGFIGTPAERRRRLLGSLPFFFISAGFFLLFRKMGEESGIIDNAPQGFTSSAFLDKAATAVQIPWFYLKKSFWPLGLSANYDVRFATAWHAPAVWGALAGLVLLAVIVAARTRRSPLPLFVAGWFLITLLPVLNFFATIPVVADRYAYLPLFALCYLAAGFLLAVPQKAGLHRGGYVAAATAALVFAGVSFGRNGIWRTDLTLWEETVRVSPGEMKNRVNLATARFAAKQYDKALDLLVETKKSNPYYDYYHLFEGHLALERKDLPAAAGAFRQALAKHENFLDALYLLGETYEKMGEYERAVEFYNKTIFSTELDTSQYRESARKALERLLTAMNPDIEERRRRVRERPGDIIGRMLLAEKLSEFARYDEALVNFLEMEKLGITSWKLFTSIARTYVKLKDYPQAARYFEKSLAVNPTNADTLNSLAVVYRKTGRQRDALPLLERAAAAEGGDGSALFNLGLAHYQMGDRANSIRWFTMARDRFPQIGSKVAPYLEELRSTPGGAP